MRLKTWTYSINIAISFIFFFTIGTSVYAQQQQPRKVPHKRTTPKVEEKKVVVPDSIPFFNGLSIGVDLFGPGAYLLGSEEFSSEVSLKVNLKNKYIPAIEFGMGGADTWNETGIHYKSKSAPYFRIGMDYNTMSKKKNKKNFLYVGFRYAFTSFNYNVASLPQNDPIWKDQINNPPLQDEIWGGSIPFQQTGIKGSMQWLEVLAGVKINIYKNLNMGWALRVKHKLSASSNDFGNLWYVPGFGKYATTNLGITYSIIYQLPF